MPSTSPDSAVANIARLSFLLDARPSSSPAVAEISAALELFELAESQGYGAGWLRDHPAALTILAAVSQRTQRLELGVWVSAPARVDGELRLPELATLDALSSGRLRILLGPAAGGTSVTLGDGGVVRRMLLPLDGAGASTARRFRELADQRFEDPRAIDVPVLVGTSDQLLEVLSSDPLLGTAEELVLDLPSALPSEELAQVLHDVACYVAPELGWRAPSAHAASAQSPGETVASSRTLADRAA